MAPSGPRRGGGRPSRGQSKGGQGPVRSAIAKRRGAGARTDRDGDLDMDGPSTGGPSTNSTRPAPTGPRNGSRGGGGGSATSTRSSQPTTKAQQIVSRMLRGRTGTLSERVASSTDPAARARPSRVATVVVKGLQESKAASNEGGGLMDLKSFLERKARAHVKSSRDIRIKKSQLVGDLVYFTVNKEDADELIRLGGYEFAGARLEIYLDPEEQAAAARVSAQTQAVKVQLEGMLSKRYNPDAKLLDLSSLGSDEVLNNMNMFQEATPEKLFAALMTICDQKFTTAREKREGIVSISLAGNNIDNVSQIRSLPDTFPDLVNLDLSRNKIRTLIEMQKWKYRFRSLETLLLNENPIDSLPQNQKNEMASWWVKLHNLSGVQVKAPEIIESINKIESARARGQDQSGSSKSSSVPVPIPQHGPDFRDINRVGEGFVTEFIHLYDNDRAALAGKYYDERSTFSYAINMRSPHSSEVALSPWTHYTKLSRNHINFTHAPARLQRLSTGTSSIATIWGKLPATRHPPLATQFQKYIIDCHPLQGLADPTGQSPTGVDGMIITMHGEFEDLDPDTNATGLRSFSRTFVIGPGKPGRNPIRVVSDMLALKAYNPVATPTPAPAVSAPVQNGIQNGTPPAIQSEEAQKQQVILELCKHTNMTPEYSKMCLEVVNWNLEQALVSFNERKGQLPPEAFVSM